jgi:hypothetical protein
MATNHYNPEGYYYLSPGPTQGYNTNNYINHAALSIGRQRLADGAARSYGGARDVVAPKENWNLKVQPRPGLIISFVHLPRVEPGLIQ